MIGEAIGQLAVVLGEGSGVPDINGFHGALFFCTPNDTR